MAIREITVKNFKGIAESTQFEIKPITIFIGPNSSGKSSCLHALAALAQTIKLGNSIPALILDDEYAHVHLGRFIEIAHSKSYTSGIQICLNLGKTDVTFDQNTYQGICSANYTFKCRKNTEEIYLSEANLSIGDFTISIKKQAKSDTDYFAKSNKFKLQCVASRKSNFSFQLAHPDKTVKHFEHWFGLYILLEHIQSLVEQNLRATKYLGPFRQSPLRRYPFRGTTASEVGPQGEATITMLASEVVQPKDKPHFKQINNWLVELGLAKKVGVARVSSSDLFDVSLTLNDDEVLPIADLGYGLSQVLPVLTQCSFAPKNSTLLFEQPELHLHEGAARKLAGVFVDTAKKKNANLIIETHSKELIHELFNHLKTGTLHLDDLVIYSVKRVDGRSLYDKLDIEVEDGTVEVSDPWVNELVK